MSIGFRIGSHVGGVLLNASTFTPASLFTNNGPGAWYDPSDLSSLAQNSDGTGSVSENDIIKYVGDKSGNGNHATQSNGSKAPVLRKDANGKYYLEFDGTDDVLEVPAIDFTGSGQLSAFAAAQSTANDAFRIIYESEPNIFVGAGNTLLSQPGSGSSEGFELTFNDDGAFKGARKDAGYPSGTTYIVTGRTDLVSEVSLLRIDGSQVVSDNGPYTISSFSNKAAGLGGRKSGLRHWSGFIYGFVIIGSFVDPEDTESFLADKAGITI